ncbi:PREDICTED: triokinase/FMN cyclase-like [Priapulus caudatus]|uniref:Triokinase/FMN cyclase n=1 Tax=Priapulus caudatus TaxID=37621 RepID=A0ABM1EQQ4_PRICU|nr:PREDICTED: triokinase/FMN cyclase-like [Priapulus caudatus]
MTSNSTKKFINLPEKCVDDALEGFVQSHNNVMLVENHRVVVRQDVANLSKAGKVTLLGGGGAGHEPAFAGFVGVGMLTAAISGAVFASPPPSSILAALRAISSPAGMLMIVLNYTGDRLNFGIAAERAKAEGMRVDMLFVGDDCALTSGDKSAGRRGLCGMILAQKMAGALAEMGKSLEEVKATVTAAVKNMGTIGLSLSPCSVPGHGPTFTIGEDEMELGLGIHGEAGVRRMKLLPAAETVSVMLDHMLDQKSATCFPLKSGDAVALAVNNLGGTSVLELNIVTMEALRYLEKKGAAVEQVYAGSLITSLEMAGFSLTLLLLDDVRRSCLNQVTEAPAWPHVFWNVPRNNNLPKLREPQSIAAAQTAEQSNAKLTPDGRDALQRAVRSACEALIARHDHLNALDEGCGDGDCGSTITRGAKGVRLLEGGSSTMSL